MRRIGMLVALLAAVALATLALPAAGTTPRGAPGAAVRAPDGGRSAAGTGQANGRPPLLAYYYIWFNRRSWDRAKTDLPMLGTYDSGDAAVIRQHIRWAKAAGIDGFIVSWKSTPVLDDRLEQVVNIAESEHFGLAIIYQGLDFSRRPQPVERVGADLTYFRQHFAGRAPFHHWGRPIVVWSGTWEYTPDQIWSVTKTARSDLTVLASEKNLKGYERIAGSVDGDAYYWSSANPDTNQNFGPKLRQMSDGIHARGGMWIAPASVGFDARKVGGTKVVGRQNGDTYRQGLAGALASSPDAVGIISWNEFSENSHAEPSEEYGTCYLGVIAESNGLPAPDPAGCPEGKAAGSGGPAAAAPRPGTDRADSSSGGSGAPYGPIVLGAFGVFVLGAGVIAVRRRRRVASPPPGTGPLAAPPFT